MNLGILKQRENIVMAPAAILALDCVQMDLAYKEIEIVKLLNKSSEVKMTHTGHVALWRVLYMCYSEFLVAIVTNGRTPRVKKKSPHLFGRGLLGQ